MKYFKKLVGERIYLSPLSAEDYEQYVEWLNDFKVSDGIGASANVATISSEKEWLESSSKSSNYPFAIVSLNENKLLGNCGLSNVNFIRRTATLGIFIGNEKERGLGIGKEAINLVLDYAFNYLNLNNVMLNVFSFNEGAIKCYKSVGFKEFGRRREAYFLNGKYYDDVHMDILKSEFKGSYILNKNI